MPLDLNKTEVRCGREKRSGGGCGGGCRGRKVRSIRACFPTENLRRKDDIDLFLFLSIRVALALPSPGVDRPSCEK